MWARDRRRRRRSLGPYILVGAVIALVLGLLIGGLAHVGQSSAGYRSSITRSYGLATRPLVFASNQTGRQLETLVGTMGAGEVCPKGRTGPTTCRQILEQRLDAMVAEATQTAADSAFLVPPTPPGPVSSDFSTAFNWRAQALGQFRSSLDGLLGMSPLPVTGAPALPAQTARAATAPHLISATRAAHGLLQAGSLLRRADGRYATAAHELASQAGGVRLPASAWIGRGTLWSAANLEHLVEVLSSTYDLQARHALVLLPQAVNLVPGVIPPLAGTPTGVSVLPPTSKLQVSVVAANQGNVAEPDQTVSLDLAPVAGGPTEVASQRVSIAAGASQTVVFSGVRVRPGTSYSLRLSVSPPSGEIPGLPTSFTLTLEVAPPTPPTTTTTTEPPTTAPRATTSTAPRATTTTARRATTSTARRP